MLNKTIICFHAGELLEYDCQNCHTTGASYDGKMDNLPGINGSWEFRGIQCEACHATDSKDGLEDDGYRVVITKDL
ncbi:cytochrome c2 [Methanohalophilus levihalophilus]|uniref:multiheme c-type cytochrome n=1 Tax=Methanohalophilus levihalophilus TaxID=1431282 RepID=UPI001AE5F6DB|nr:multiheme c-type cytochrome [Methanohalophilus levihalophilus]MBP2030814.1 cytochrome c2 [Methanohalophilus levihalophilus]